MPGPARIGMLIDALAPGGAERVAVEVACALDRDRFAPFFVVTRGGGPMETPLREAGVPFTILGRRGKGIPVRMLLRARRLLRDADLINAHMFGSSVWGAVLARSTGRPLVTRDPTWSGTRSFARTRGYRHLIGPTARLIVCPSQPVAQSIADEGVPWEKLRVITNGVRISVSLPRDAARAELGLDPSEFVIGITAGLRTEKAHEVLLRAVARLRGPGRAPTLCVVGDGPRREELQHLARELGIDAVTVWAGYRPDARRLASAFDAAVICSAWEGLPLAALEVLAAGTPLVASRVGVLPQVLEGGAGVLVDAGDDEGLARELRALMDHPERAAELGEQGLRRARERYSFDAMIDSYARLYDEVLGRTAAWTA